MTYWAVSLLIEQTIIALLVLHWYAGHAVPVAKDLSHISENLLSAFIHGLAGLGQYLFPVLLLFGAAISFFNRRKRRCLYENTKNSIAEDPLKGMFWHDFELLIGEHFRREGYQVFETVGGAKHY